VVTKHQKFEVRQIRRGLIKNAAYNPRIISDEARRRLKRKIRKSGLVEPLIWNEATGNLVGGHQRLSILDELEKRDDYELTVSVVCLDAAAEKKLNVFLNNSAAMGEWDEDKLADIVKEFSDAPEDLGFDPADMDVIFEDGELGGLFDDGNDKAAPDIEKIREMKEARKDHKEQSDETEGGDHYAVLVFPDEAMRDGFLSWLGLEPGQRFVEGAAMMAALGKVMCDGGE
jgi:ParB-like chromosome segregation protein Spo0J